MARKGHFNTFMSAKATDGAGTSIDVSGFDEVVVFIGAPAGTTGTIKCRHTLEGTDLTVPNWAAAGSASNPVEGLGMQALEDNGASIVNGDTGIILAATAHAKIYRINTALSHYLNFVLSGMGGGSFTVKGYGIDKAHY